MLASDDANNQFSGARNPDEILHVTFYIRPMKDNFNSEKEGKPVFVSEQWVKIMIPGNAQTVIDCPVRPEHTVRFPRQWQQFQNSQAPVPVSGTPLEEWPAIERSRAEELKAIRFFTVEQIADCSDQQIQSVGMDGNMLRQKARAFLERAKNSALPQAQAAEIERLRKDAEQREIAHRAEMEELRKLITQSAEPKVRRAYKRRQPEQVSG